MTVSTKSKKQIKKDIEYCVDYLDLNDNQIEIVSELLLENNISLKGVKIPIYKEVYKPVLRDLKNEGIDFIRS